ncbi:MAG: hypothetical protein QM639_04935 [Rhodocyclaceae bacterium]|jgi:hypothetical protein
MKKNAVLLAFASILATTATDWAIAAAAESAVRDVREGRDSEPSEWLEGEIRQIDREAQRLVMRDAEGTLNTLRIADVALIGPLHAGQQVRYRIEAGASRWITAIEQV